MELRRLPGRLDAWLDPTLELWAGCLILVPSAGFWINPGRPIWEVRDWYWATTVGAILVGPLLVYRAWTRKPNEVKCDTCGDRVPIFEIHSDELGVFFVRDCPRCGRVFLYDVSKFVDQE
jgi:hypothetical protein